MSEKSLFEAIFEAIGKIPKGKVATYGQISRLVGGCSARVVGYAMARISEDMKLPWHRVVNSKGRVSLKENDGGDIQREMLESEGVLFDETGKIDLKKFQWETFVSE